MTTKLHTSLLALVASALALGLPATANAAAPGFSVAKGWTVNRATDAPILARRGRGADDGADHDAGDDRRGRGRGTDDAVLPFTPRFSLAKGFGSDDISGMIILARQGRDGDDRGGDDRGRGGDDSRGGDDRGRGRGSDDGPNHDANDDRGRGRDRGFDDSPSRSANDDHGRRGRGADDGAAHHAGGDDHRSRSRTGGTASGPGYYIAEDGFTHIRRGRGTDDGPNHR
ncbi:hypothetical protein [Sagittula sp. S175]|uniref:hypothetical protein n=1 Tax=Sagittula sp. S175 TaxID=3415129 RepID=UPI003C7DA358